MRPSMPNHQTNHEPSRRDDRPRARRPDDRQALRIALFLCIYHVGLGTGVTQTLRSLSENAAGGNRSALLAPWPVRGDPSGPAFSENRPVSWKLLVPNVLEDQGRVWLFPTRLAKGDHWKPTLGFAAVTAGLLAADPSEASYFRATSSFHTFNQVFSSTNTGAAMIALPVSFYATSLVRHNVYDQHTSLLAGEAVLDSELLATVMKSTIRRLRPSEVPPGRGFTDTFTDARGGFFSGQGSSPSGHAIAAFSIATVFSPPQQYLWVDWAQGGGQGCDRARLPSLHRCGSRKNVWLPLGFCC